MEIQQRMIDYLIPFGRGGPRVDRLRNRPSLMRFIANNRDLVMRFISRFPTVGLATRALQSQYIAAFNSTFPSTIRVTGKDLNIEELYEEAIRRRNEDFERVLELFRTDEVPDFDMDD